MNKDSQVDWRKLQDLLFVCQLKEKGDFRSIDMIMLFYKYGLSVEDGCELLMEIGKVFMREEGGDYDDGKN